MTLAGQPSAQEPISAFLDRAASRTPVPGGGAIALLLAAAAASMGEMAARFTIGARGAEPADEAVAADLAEALAQARGRLLELMDQDAAAFARVAAARRLPRADEVSHGVREEQVAAAVLEAIAAPLGEARIAAAALARLAAAVPRLNRNLITDAGVCAHGLLAGLLACGLNVRVNCRMLPSDTHASASQREMQQLEQTARACAQAALDVVNRVLSE